MLSYIQSFDFFFRARTQADCSPDQMEDQNHAQYRIGSDCHHTKALYPELMKTAAIEQASGTICLVAGEKPDCNCPPDPVHTMHSNSTHRVIDMKVHIQQLYSNIYQDPGSDPDQESSDGIHTGTSRRDGNKTGK